MDCERIKSRLSDYLEGSLPEGDLAEVDAHLRICPQCASEADGLKETVALLHTLPPVKAPPELMEKVRAEIARGTDGKPLWKKLFLPAHVKIPLEAAAVAALFLLVVATYRDQFPKEIPTWTAERRDAAPPAPKSEVPAKAPAVERRAPAVRKGESEPAIDATRDTARAAAGSGVRKETAAPLPVEKRKESAFTLPTVAAQRISTDAGKIEAGGVAAAEEKSAETVSPRVLAAPPSRLLLPLPFGRDVTIEVTGEERPGLEERIAAAAMKLGGTFSRTPSRPALPDNTASVDVVRVHVPTESAETFLAELSQLGTLPQEGMSTWADFPAGPSPGVVAYRVRIRVR